MAKANIRSNPYGDQPVIHESAYIDPTAIIIGKVIIHEEVFVGPYAVIRADELNEHGEMAPIEIGAKSNIQDAVVIHSKSGGKVQIGENTSIAHSSIVHGPCTLGNGVFVGFNSVVFSAIIQDNCCIGHAVMVSDVTMPSGRSSGDHGRITAKTDLSTLPEASSHDLAFAQDVAVTNVGLVKGYQKVLGENKQKDQ